MRGVEGTAVAFAVRRGMFCAFHSLCGFGKVLLIPPIPLREQVAQNVCELFCFLPLIQCRHKQGVMGLDAGEEGPLGPASARNIRYVLKH